MPSTVTAPSTVPPRRARTCPSPLTLTVNRLGADVIVTAEPPSMGVTGNSYHAEPSMVHSKNTSPCWPAGGALGEAEGLMLVDGLTLADTERLMLADGLALPDGDTDALADELTDGLTERDTDAEGEPLTLADGDAEPLGLALPDGDAVGDADPLGERDVDGDNDADADADGLTETDVELDGLALALSAAAKLTWMPRRANPATSIAVPLPVDSAASWKM